MAVSDGRQLKEADCKNTFYNGVLSEDEICIVKPPSGCPQSSGSYWKLNKKLYGLCCSARHWFKKISGHLIDNIGFKTMSQDKCVLKCTLFEGQPPIYVGLYANNFVHYSTSDKVEEWFKQQLKSHVKVDFMGDVSWFLGQQYDWHTDPAGSVSCHVFQQACIDNMLNRHGMDECTPSRTPY